ncbi:hypothetical protein AB0H93_43915, partial [Saccharopolyspora sp. NPDC050642]
MADDENDGSNSSNDESNDGSNSSNDESNDGSGGGNDESNDGSGGGNDESKDESDGEGGSGGDDSNVVDPDVTSGRTNLSRATYEEILFTIAGVGKDLNKILDAGSGTKGWLQFDTGDGGRVATSYTTESWTPGKPWFRVVYNDALLADWRTAVGEIDSYMPQVTAARVGTIDWVQAADGVGMIRHYVNWLDGAREKTAGWISRLDSPDAEFKGRAAYAIQGHVRQINFLLDDLYKQITHRNPSPAEGLVDVTSGLLLFGSEMGTAWDSVSGGLVNAIENALTLVVKNVWAYVTGSGLVSGDDNYLLPYFKDKSEGLEYINYVLSSYDSRTASAGKGLSLHTPDGVGQGPAPGTTWRPPPLPEGITSLKADLRSELGWSWINKAVSESVRAQLQPLNEAARKAAARLEEVFVIANPPFKDLFDKTPPTIGTAGGGPGGKGGGDGPDLKFDPDGKGGGDGPDLKFNPDGKGGGDGPELKFNPDGKGGGGSGANGGVNFPGGGSGANGGVNFPGGGSGANGGLNFDQPGGGSGGPGVGLNAPGGGSGANGGVNFPGGGSDPNGVNFNAPGGGSDANGGLNFDQPGGGSGGPGVGLNAPGGGSGANGGVNFPGGGSDPNGVNFNAPGGGSDANGGLNFDQPGGGSGGPGVGLNAPGGGSDPNGVNFNQPGGGGFDPFVSDPNGRGSGGLPLTPFGGVPGSGGTNPGSGRRPPGLGFNAPFGGGSPGDDGGLNLNRNREGWEPEDPSAQFNSPKSNVPEFPGSRDDGGLNLNRNREGWEPEDPTAQFNSPKSNVPEFPGSRDDGGLNLNRNREGWEPEDPTAQF